MKPKFKCPIEDYSLLQKVRNHLIVLKNNLADIEQRRDYYLKAENFRMADFYTTMAKSRIQQIKQLEKEIAQLESLCFV